MSILPADYIYTTNTSVSRGQFRELLYVVSLSYSKYMVNVVVRNAPQASDGSGNLTISCAVQ